MFRKWRKPEKNEGSYGNERSYDSNISERDQSHDNPARD